MHIRYYTLLISRSENLALNCAAWKKLSQQMLRTYNLRETSPHLHPKYLHSWSRILHPVIRVYFIWVLKGFCAWLSYATENIPGKSKSIN